MTIDEGNETLKQRMLLKIKGKERNGGVLSSFTKMGGIGMDHEHNLFPDHIGDVYNTSVVGKGSE